MRAAVTLEASLGDWSVKKALLSATTWQIKSIDGYGTEFTFGTCTTPAISTRTLPGAVVGDKYTAGLAVVGNRAGAWKISAGTLPSGLRLSGRLISGTPTAAGRHSFKVTFTDTHGRTASMALTIVVAGQLSWSAVPAELPGDWPADANTGPDGVSCPTADFCAAVGTDGGPNNAIWFRKDGRWTTGEKIPVPADAAAAPGGTMVWVDLPAVSCASASLCVVVGTYYSETSGVDQVPLVMTWANGVWKQGSLLYNGEGDSDFSGVSCPTTSYCVAVGTDVNNDNSTDQGLVATWTGGEWAVGDAPVSGMVTLDNVSCPTASSCTAIGAVYDISGAETDVLLLTSSGTEWSGHDVALPSSGSAPSKVACPTTSYCVAVGWLNSTSVLTVVNGQPKYQTVPDAPLLNAVSCSSASSCVAVGSHNNTANAHDGLFLTLANGKWTVSAAPGPPGALAVGEVVSVSCAPAAPCAATGSYESQTSGEDAGMLLSSAAAA